LPEVLKAVPNAVYILGGAGDDLPRVKSMVKEKSLEEKVILTGFIPDEELVDYYNLCDVFVMPSKGEGFGIVFIEALACGKPVIAGNQDGSRDAVLDGECGILVNPDKLEEIAESIIKVFKKEVSGKILDGRYLRKRVLEAYGFDRFKEKVKNLLYVLSR
jgi:glycosyltransferase involved in cell wall biosynthesis